MSESNSDNKEIVEAEVVSEATSDVNKVEIEKVEKTTKAEKVVATEAVSDEEVGTAPSIAEIKKEDKKEDASSSFNYFSIAAGILLVVTLTAVTFFQDEYESVVASLMSITATEEVAEVAEVAIEPSSTVQEAELVAVEEIASQELVVDVSNDNVQVADQMIQAGYARVEPNYAYQSMVMNQARNNSFDEMVQKQRAAYDNAMRMRNERINEMHRLRTASLQRMDQNQADLRKKMETMRIKTQQIQLEMQQKMQAAYNEFHAI